MKRPRLLRVPAFCISSVPRDSSAPAAYSSASRYFSSASRYFSSASTTAFQLALGRMARVVFSASGW